RIGPRLLKAGHTLAVYDIRQAAAASLCQQGAHWAGSVNQLAEAADVIITSLPSSAIVEDVALSQENGLIGAMRSGCTYIDMSTSTPWLAEKIAAAFLEAGIDALDAPLSSGGVYIGVGGNRDAFERCRPVLDAVGTHVFWVGGPG